MRPILAFAALALCVAPAAAAPVDATWTEVARVSDGACEMTVTGNGRFYRIEVLGLTAGEGARYRLSNGDMPPIDWRITADDEGRFARYYLPFRTMRLGDEVAVDLVASTCTLSTAFRWERMGIVVH